MATTLDPRFETAKILINHEHVKSFSEIFDHLPKSVMAAELKTNNNRFSKLMFKPVKFRLEELVFIAYTINVPVDTIIRLALAPPGRPKKNKL